MLTLTLRSLRTHRSRLTLTIVAVAAAVSFVVASFVLADSLRAVFGDVAAEIYDGVDAEIRAGAGTFDTTETGDRFDASAIGGIAGVDGVASVVPGLGAENVVFAVGPDGEVLRRSGPPTLALSTSGDAAASPFATVSGAAPAPGQVMLDVAQARTLAVGVGDPVRVAGPAGTETFVVSGTIVFGAEESGVSPSFLLFDLTTLQRLLDAPGRIDRASVVFADGVDVEAALSAVAARLPGGLIVADRATLVAERNAEFGEVIGLIGTALLAFAALTLFVSVFVIANTFAVVVGQQRCQLGLLRAIGARRGQVTALVAAEAAVAGAIASVVGVAGGLGVAEGIKALVEAVTSGGFPEGPTRVLPRTIVAALAVGVGVTTLAALLPARRAGAVPPLAAMRGAAGGGPATAGTGRVASFLGRVLDATIGRLGAPGRLAATGVARHPRRVLTTSMAMVVGLAVVAAMGVLGASHRTTLRAAAASGLDADLVVVGDDGVTVPFAAIDGLRRLPEVAAASGYGVTEVLHDGAVTRIAHHRSATARGVVVLEPTAGALVPLTVGEAYVTEDFAADAGLGVGDTTSVEFSDGHRADLTVRAIVAASPVIDAPIIVDTALVSAHARNAEGDLAAVRFAVGVDPGAAEAAVVAALSDHPQLAAVSVDVHVAGRQARADQILMLANGLLGLTIAVALVGIANTVALSLLERRSELGLLRAVGMSRRQVRRMVRYEALVLSSLGAVVGVAVGVALASLAVAFVPDGFARSLEIPFGSLAAYAATGIAFGVAAAALPARRAARLDVLDAIAVPT